jgi:hypothetical protein
MVYGILHRQSGTQYLARTLDTKNPRYKEQTTTETTEASDDRNKDNEAFLVTNL